tara:strand:- start:335 stop:775 length:441 start_codon:yes stop_codon:yes gene_type:complete
MLSRASGIKNQRRDKSRTDKEIDLTGIKGELAASKVYKAEFNPYDLGVDSGIDIMISDIGIDIKTTTYLTGKLLFKNIESFKAPIAILCLQKNEDTVIVAGWINKKDFQEKSEPFNGGMAVTQDKLNSPESLWLNLINKEVSVKKG